MLWCVLNFVPLLSVLLVPWVGQSYEAVAFPGHIHLPFGFPVASQAKYFLRFRYSFTGTGTHVDLKHFIPVTELYHKTTEQQNIFLSFNWL